MRCVAEEYMCTISVHIQTMSWVRRLSNSTRAPIDNVRTAADVVDWAIHLPPRSQRAAVHVDVVNDGKAREDFLQERRKSAKEQWRRSIKQRNIMCNAINKQGKKNIKIEAVYDADLFVYIKKSLPGSKKKKYELDSLSVRKLEKIFKFESRPNPEIIFIMNYLPLFIFQYQTDETAFTMSLGHESNRNLLEIAKITRGIKEDPAAVANIATKEFVDKCLLALHVYYSDQTKLDVEKQRAEEEEAEEKRQQKKRERR